MASDDDDISLMSGGSDDDEEEALRQATASAAANEKDKDLLQLEQATLWAEVRGPAAPALAPGASGSLPSCHSNRPRCRQPTELLAACRLPTAQRPCCHPSCRWTPTSWSAWR